MYRECLSHSLFDPYEPLKDIVRKKCAILSKKMKILSLLCCSLLLAAPSALAKTQIIEATGVYQMGENDTIAAVRENARKDAMRNAAEKAGVYVRSYSRTKNLKLTDDQVEVISVQTMQVKDCKYRQDYINNTLVIHADIKASVDDNDFQKRIDANNQIQDLKSQLAEEKEKNRAAINKKMRETGNDPYAELLAENEYQRLQKNPGSLSVVRSNFEDFVAQRGGMVPADIYGRIALLDLMGTTYRDSFENDIEKAVEADPKDPFNYTLWALYKESVYDHYGAEAMADQALRLDKRHWPAYYVRSIAKGFRGSTRKAMADCDTAIRRGGKNYAYVLAYRARLQRVFAGRHDYVDFESDDHDDTISSTISGFYRDFPQLKRKIKK